LRKRQPAARVADKAVVALAAVDGVAVEGAAVDHS